MIKAQLYFPGMFRFPTLAAPTRADRRAVYPINSSHSEGWKDRSTLTKMASNSEKHPLRLFSCTWINALDSLKNWGANVFHA